MGKYKYRQKADTSKFLYSDNYCKNRDKFLFRLFYIAFSLLVLIILTAILNN